MLPYRSAAARIRALIRDKQIQSGEALPSERSLAKQWSVSHGVIRLAYDLLVEEGVIERRHGKGTFLRESSPTGGNKRLGLLLVDQDGRVSEVEQALALQLQIHAMQSGYELVVEHVSTPDLLMSNLPRMIAQRSVDGVILHGRVRDFHVEYFENLGLCVACTGVNPLEPRHPQVCMDYQRLGYEITRELLQAGRNPVWLDGDPLAGKRYYAGVELARGYSDAVREFGPSASLHISALKPHRVDEMATQMGREPLENAALIAQNWSWPLLAGKLTEHYPQARNLWVVPLPVERLNRVPAPVQAVRWDRYLDGSLDGEWAVRSLVERLEHRPNALFGARFIPQCKLTLQDGQPCMTFTLTVQQQTQSASASPAVAEPQEQNASPDTTTPALEEHGG